MLKDDLSLTKLYTLFREKVAIKDNSSLTSFSEPNPDKIKSLYQLGIEKQLLNNMDITMFSSAWGIVLPQG